MHRPDPVDSGRDLFRPEALQQRNGPLSSDGEVLRLTPSWIGGFYWLLVSVFLGALLYVSLGSVNEYAEGPALLEVDGRVELTARQAGIVSKVAVRPHQSVVAGQLLVDFYRAQETAELDSARQEYRLRFIEWLRRPADRSVRTALAALQARIDHAESRLAERSLRAPHGGIVSGIRVRPGQRVSPGEAVLALVAEDSEVSIVAMLPGHYRPLLRPGQPLHLELSGYPYADHRLTIETIDDEVIGPDAVRRYLGGSAADTITVPGGVVLVRARLPAASFDAAGQTHSFHDGMQGWAQARVDRARIIHTLIPGMRNLVRTRAD